MFQLWCPLLLDQQPEGPKEVVNQKKKGVIAIHFLDAVEESSSLRNITIPKSRFSDTPISSCL